MKPHQQAKNESDSPGEPPPDATRWNRVYAVVLTCFLAIVAAMYLFTIRTR